jgi:alpha-ketoglutarate-dependent taurine dioxygenase
MANADIRVRPMGSGERCGVIVEAAGEPSLTEWAASETGALDELIHRHGAVLLRGFRTDGRTQEIGELVTRLSGPPLDYTERSSPRTEISPGIYTSTDYPQDKSIFLHNEQSYNLRFPERLYFYCVDAADEGGETTIADSRRIYDRLPTALRERIVDTGYRIVRNYRPHLGLPWQDVFQTADRAEVERYCADNEIELEWLGGDELRTRQHRRVRAKHPVTGELCWFNHMTFFHVTTLGEEPAALLVDAYGIDGLPTNTVLGDGNQLDPESLRTLRAAYEAESVPVAWRNGDLLIVDNMLASHGRAPYRGSRRVVVSMGGGRAWTDVAA